MTLRSKLDMARSSRRKVVVVQRRLTHYRVRFFDELRSLLSRDGVDLILLVGEAAEDEKAKNDSGKLNWAIEVPITYFLGGKLCWQDCGHYLSDVDLVIVTQENKLLMNYKCMLGRRDYKLAYWGHGANFQSSSKDGVREAFKRWLVTKVDWWFAYTELSVEKVAAAGFRVEKITLVNNSVDTNKIRDNLGLVSINDQRILNQKYGIDGAVVGLFIGSLYKEKKLEFLFEASLRIKEKVPAFRLVVVGDGPERNFVEGWCRDKFWADYVGAQFGADKALWLSRASLVLNPYSVGLGILDSFVGGVPIVTTNLECHGPEIAYLVDDVNGVVTEASVNEYAQECIQLLGDPCRLKKLQEGALKSGLEYTVENMASRFAGGILKCIEPSHI